MEYLYPIVFQNDPKHLGLKDVSLVTPQRPNTDPHKVWLEEYLEDRAPWLVSSQWHPFVSHLTAIWKGSHNPILRERKLTMVINNLLTMDHGY